MLPISEKSNFMKSFHINEILKLIALEQYVKQNKIKRIFTTNLNKTTNDVISFIARRNKIIFFKRNEKKIFSLDLGIVNFFKAFFGYLIIYIREGLCLDLIYQSGI